MVKYVTLVNIIIVIVISVVCGFVMIEYCVNVNIMHLCVTLLYFHVSCFVLYTLFLPMHSVLHYIVILLKKRTPLWPWNAGGHL